jgi:hypothetical protein
MESVCYEAMHRLYATQEQGNIECPVGEDIEQHLNSKAGQPHIGIQVEITEIYVTRPDL